MPRLTLAWRVALVLIVALMALQVVSAAAFFLQRSAATEAGFRAPLPDQIAALAALLDHAASAEQQLILRALNGAHLSAVVRDTPVPTVVEGRRLGWLERAIRRNLPPGDARAVVAVREGASGGETRTRGLRVPLAGDPIEIIVGLDGGRSLRLAPAARLNVGLFGLPAGFVASLLGFAIALLAGFAILREMRPISRLAAAVERFGHGLEAQTLPEHGAPETRSLVRAFNAMQRRIARLVAGRTFVVAAIAHDLRTHLTRLRLRVAMISDDSVRERAERDVEDMQALVEEALAYARATRGSGDHQPLDLGAMVGEAVEARAEVGYPARFAPPPSPIRVTASRPSLARAVGNLIDNAVIYGGSADVSVVVGDGEATIWVEDRGPGIAPADRERILEPFERLEHSRGRETGGTGLGLAIVREIVEAHDGRIRVEDRPGGGMRFGITLPALG